METKVLVVSLLLGIQKQECHVLGAILTEGFKSVLPQKIATFFRGVLTMRQTLYTSSYHLTTSHDFLTSYFHFTDEESDALSCKSICLSHSTAKQGVEDQNPDPLSLLCIPPGSLPASHPCECQSLSFSAKFPFNFYSSLPALVPRCNPVPIFSHFLCNVLCISSAMVIINLPWKQRGREKLFVYSLL